jgi:hypothetical protein
VAAPLRPSGSIPVCPFQSDRSLLSLLIQHSPGGGVNQSLSDNNRTLWPLDGGAIALTPTHHWAQTYINLGLGRNVTRFNITLMAPFNQTSNGTFCLPDVKLPEGLNLTEGDMASIQVVQLSATGGALYNVSFSCPEGMGPADEVSAPISSSRRMPRTPERTCASTPRASMRACWTMMDLRERLMAAVTEQAVTEPAVEVPPMRVRWPDMFLVLSFWLLEWSLLS